MPVAPQRHIITFLPHHFELLYASLIIFSGLAEKGGRSRVAPNLADADLALDKVLQADFWDL